MSAILTPLNDPNYLQNYIDAGADEFYSGFYDPMWFAAFGPFVDLNRMSGFRLDANASNFSQILGLVQMVKAAGKRIYITFNTAAYAATAVPVIKQYFDQLSWWGADGVILSGPELIDSAKSAGLQAVASTMCGIFNRQIAKFYANCGIDRMILPRDLAFSEIAAIVESTPEIEHEVFLMRDGCIYSDSHCLGMHGMGRGALCGELVDARRHVRTTLSIKEVKKNSMLHARAFHKFTCGLCALWDFEQLGIDSYKIVGRGGEGDDIMMSIRLVRDELAIARTCANRREYFDRMLPHPYADTVCNHLLNCYYPELRLK